MSWVNGAVEFYTIKIRVLLTTDQRTYVISLASIAHVILNTIIVVVLANLSKYSSFTAGSISIFLRSLILMVYVKIR